VSPVVTGGLLGLMFATGLVLAVRASPPMRPIRLADRLAPYLGAAPAPSRLLERPSATSAPFTVVRRLFGPTIGEVVSLVDRLVGGSTSVRRRLGGLSDAMTVDEFRLEQVVWGALGMVGAGGVVVLIGLARAHVDAILVLGAVLLGLVGGVLARDWWLTKQVQQREAAMLAEFPVVADLLALSVVAGEAPADALTRVCRLTGGELARDLEIALAEARAGRSLIVALADLSRRTTLEPFARFLDGVIVAIERGTPLADVLRAQAADVREVGKRALLEAAGRKEISMMVPVVFLILPTTVLFALYPGVITLVSLTH
jgi:tight adherence protein C